MLMRRKLTTVDLQQVFGTDERLMSFHNYRSGTTKSCFTFFYQEKMEMKSNKIPDLCRRKCHKKNRKICGEEV